MSTVKFTEEHEWIAIDGNIATVGITAYAAEQLGDVVFVELPAVGKAVTQGGDAAVVESVKAASEVYAPISGEITEANPALDDEPATVNADPEGAGWFFKMTIGDASELDGLMDANAYKSFVEGLG
ncbi:MAG: glycine cleavage system protein GcvH [Rhodospirillales bacterium]|nr:glycine cleavage system protein GcvH [Rhodospirillales bacterium]MCW8863211.1 glycine cleavage system protein GcvH [Rhodospirillales bacterium]MCW8953003.1 glycine cleavage system protein GcvH [Rhodospirillales bacterium]MCW8970820.1 glycine cleavage system protein GcvH [Rhodospirillales bacterium]MCW9001549.1 glycine cleavage system protein GcvH [Rhodospirillales bacterium]